MRLALVALVLLAVALVALVALVRRLAGLRAEISAAESRLARRLYTLQGRVVELDATVRELEFERRRRRGEIRFAADTRLEDAFGVHPRVREILGGFGLSGGGCAGGTVDGSKTIGEACADASLDPAAVLDALRRFVEDPDAPLDVQPATARIYRIGTLPPSSN